MSDDDELDAKPVVLDSSAILALLNEEPGADRVVAMLDRAIVAAANLAEVAAKLTDRGLQPGEVAEVLSILHDIRPMTPDQALTAGTLRAATRHLGLSLGDRACLALAMELGATAMTCDGAWSGVDPDAIGEARIALLR